MINRRFRYAPTTAALLAAALQGSPAWAQEDVYAPGPGMNGLPDDDRTKWGLGLGVGVQRQPYTGIESKTRALPLVFFENRYVRVFGLGGDFKLPSAGPVSFALRLRYSADGYEASDAPILNGMEERKGTVLGGGVATWRTGYGILSAEALGDLGGRSKGWQAKFGYDMPLRFGRFGLTPHVAAVWLDRETVDYYYGVRSSEALANRPAYDGRSTVDAEAGVRASYALAPRQLLTFDVGITRFGAAIKDSPLVDRSSQGSVRLGYLYRF